MAINCSLTSGKYKELLDEITNWSEKASSKSYFKDPYAVSLHNSFGSLLIWERKTLSLVVY